MGILEDFEEILCGGCKRCNESGEEDEHHLRVHRFVPAVLLVQPDVLQPDKAFHPKFKFRLAK